jgi:hypothetical protein
MKAGINPRPAGALLAWMLHDIDNIWPREIGSGKQLPLTKSKVIGG